MRSVILLAALLMYGSAPVQAQKGVQHIASAVKGKVWQLGATGVMASLLLFNAPTGVEAGQYAEAAKQAAIKTDLEIADEVRRYGTWDPLPFNTPTGLEEGQYVEAARQAAIKTDLEIASEIQQLTDDILARHISEAVPVQLLFPVPGLLDNLPASVRKLEVSRVKQVLQQLLVKIDEFAEGMEDLGMARQFNNGASLEQSEWQLHEILLKAKNKRLRTKPRNIDQLLQHLQQQTVTVAELKHQLASSEADEYDKLKFAQQLGVLQARTTLTLDAIKKLERDKAKQRHRMRRFGR